MRFFFRAPRSARLSPLVALALALGVPAAARAALPWAPCNPTGFQCAALTVPLDRSGAVPGAVTLSTMRRPASAVPQATSAIVTLAGGPGQAAEGFATDFADIFRAGLGTRDLLVFDQRGTGKSARLSCSALNATKGTLATAVARCADQLGPKRGFFRTPDTVDDLEALRVAGGYSKLVLFGVSYGTKVALAYAAAHPDAVEALILDSTVPLDGPDALSRNTLAALPRVLGESLCGQAACADATPNINGELRKLAATLTRKRASGPIYSASGKRRTAKIDASGLLNVIQAGDLNPEVRAELPAAVHAAIKHDLAPLLRLSARAVDVNNADSAARLAATEDDNESLYLATMCEETASLPWDRASGITARIKQAQATILALPAGTGGLFPASVALSGLPSLCLGWPNASPSVPAAAAALPNVPALLITGEYDTRTPSEDTLRVAAQLPLSRVVSVPYTGHSVLTSDLGTCAQGAVDAFLSGAAIPAVCTDEKDLFPVTSLPPRTLGTVRKASGLPGKAGRTLNGVAMTVVDATQQVLSETFTTGNLPRALGGLRGGFVRVRSRDTYQLVRYEFIRGLRLSGTLRAKGVSRFTVRGSAANGTVKFSVDGRATGRLDGKKFDLRPRASSARFGASPDLLAAALSRPRLH